MSRPATPREEDLVIAALQPVVTVLGKTLGRNAEVVLHDLRRPENSVAAISNGHVTGRSVGSPLIAGPLEDQGVLALRESLIAPDDSPYTLKSNYISQTKDGRQLRSSTVILHNAKREPYAAICANCDLTVFQALQTYLGTLLNVDEGEATEHVSLSSVDDLMADIMDEAIRLVGKPVAMMDKDDKLRAVELMEERGLFMVRSSVEQAGQALGVTRFTIYNYLEEIRAKVKVRKRGVI